MIGNGYWATGITVDYSYSGQGKYGWRAVVEFCDDGFADDSHAGRVSTEGKLTTRYAIVDSDGGDGLTAAVDAVKADAERLGIAFIQSAGAGPRIYCAAEGDDSDYPDGWRELVDAQSARLGWEGLYVRA
jgi:hypothetical protein